MTSCPRSFEAEAARDGRLTGAALAAFARHARGCPACAREVRALEALADGLRALPVEGGDELLALRERTRLVATFEASLLQPPRRWRGGLVWWAAVAAVVAVAVARWWPRSEGAPAIAVEAAGDATWSRRTEADRETITLARGTLSIHVDHAAGGGRLRVELPDGELEDRGTTFTVSAAGGRTTKVAVEEGSVLLRLRGQPPITIGASGTWQPAEPPVRAPAAPPAPIAPVVDGPRPTPRHLARPRGVAPAVADPAAEFRAAVGALDAGDARGAAVALARFLAEHPGDPRAEDAAYLEVIALQRCGDGEATKQAAGRYLERFPVGFRRAEIERLSR